jgi:8-oxo-dGTP pyrophosphatase MutT (NUDIX family)
MFSGEGKAAPKKAKGKRRGGKKPIPVKAKVQQEFSAGFILYRESEAGPLFLLLDYGKHWDYAKGHLEEGETAWQAAVRELREETGIRQVDRVTTFQRDMHYIFFSPRKGRIHKTVTYFLGRTRTQTVTISDEHRGYAWLPFEEAMEKLTYDNARDVLAGAHEALLKSLK